MMGFRVKRYGSFGHGWLSEPIRALNHDEPSSRGIAPRRYAQIFATREEGQNEIDAMTRETPGLFQFEIVPEETRWVL
jgi:hypothetical protein